MNRILFYILAKQFQKGVFYIQRKTNKMKKISIVFLIGMVLYGCGATKALVMADKAPVMVDIDLVNVTDDKVMVKIDPGAFSSEIVA